MGFETEVSPIPSHDLQQVTIHDWGCRHREVVDLWGRPIDSKVIDAPGYVTVSPPEPPYPCRVCVSSGATSHAYMTFRPRPNKLRSIKLNPTAPPFYPQQSVSNMMSGTNPSQDILPRKTCQAIDLWSPPTPFTFGAKLRRYR